MLEIQDLTKKYGKHLAVDHVSFTVPDGKVGILLGPNGAGKSTIIKSIAGLLRFEGGVGLGVHIPGILFRIDENRSSLFIAYGITGGGKSDVRRKYYIPRLYSYQAQRQMDCRCTRAERRRISAVCVLLHFLFKSIDIGAQRGYTLVAKGIQRLPMPKGLAMLGMVS